MRSPRVDLLLVGLLACERPPPSAPSDSGATDALTASFSVDEATENPDLSLAWRATVSADRPVRVTLDIRGAGTRRVVAFAALAAEHELPVLGLRADTDYTIAATVTDAQGESARPSAALVHTGPLPSRFPVFDVLTFAEDRVAPGYTLVDAKVSDAWVDLIVLDPGLAPVWVLEGQRTVTDARLDDAGALWMLASGGVVQLDLLGGVGHQWGGVAGSAPFTDLPDFHPNHEMFPDGAGGFYTIANQPTDVPAYPRDYAAPLVLGGPATISDPVVAHVLADGSTDLALPLSARLQTTRISFDALDFDRGEFQWGHANSLCRDPVDGSFLVGLRHQDALVKLSATGELQWILGDPAGWAPDFAPYLLAPVGDVTWPYHAHGACAEEDGSIVLFDNNNDGHTPYDPPPPGFVPVSRARAYRVDEGARTVSLAWSREATTTGALSSPAIGDADLLPNGNVLADFGMVSDESGRANESAGWGSRSARLVEWDPDGEVVLDVRLRSDLAVEPAGWSAYRAERLPSLYPSTGPWAAVETWISPASAPPHRRSPNPASPPAASPPR